MPWGRLLICPGRLATCPTDRGITFLSINNHSGLAACQPAWSRAFIWPTIGAD
jgi:hypothetical protein